MKAIQINFMPIKCQIFNLTFLKKKGPPQYLLITKKHKLWIYSSKNKNVETNDTIMTKMFGKQVNYVFGIIRKAF